MTQLNAQPGEAAAVLAGTVPAVKAAAIVPALLAITLGLFIVATVGFSHIGIIHNGAHNTRHANAFPCH